MRLTIASGSRMLIGSDAACHVVLEGARVAQRHAYVIGRDDGALELHDLGSATGTYVDGSRVSARILRGGERVTVGDHELELVHQAGTAPLVEAGQPGS